MPKVEVTQNLDTGEIVEISLSLRKVENKPEERDASDFKERALLNAVAGAILDNHNAGI